jgi:predicted PolB exonuclease-like 3'-5' exonuclease
MALTNAERQARFQKRLREKARGVDLPQRVREMMDGAVAAVWSIINRPSDDGREWAEAYDFADLEDYRVYWARQARETGLAELRQYLASYVEDANEAERQVIVRAIEVIDAAMFSHIHVPKEPQRSRRR